MNMEPVTLTRTLKVIPSEQKSLRHVEFDPGLNTERIDISYHFTPGNVVDMGLMINGRINGWSGGARKTITLSENFASPGYQRTSIVNGKWHVLLGLHKISRACEVTVEITLYPKFPRWLKGDTHLHSVHSDGSLTVSDLIARARKMEFDFLCFTDHNTIAQNHEIAGINASLCLIPGMELTSERGHANLLGVTQPVVNFLPHFTEEDIAGRIAEARRNGARIGINHPFCHYCPWQNAFTGHDWLEIWNGPWDGQTGNEDAFNYWYHLLCRGEKISAVAGSDFHKEKGLLWPYMWVHAISRERKDILSALVAGRSYMQSDDQTQLHRFCIGEAGPGDTTSGGILHVKLRTHKDNSVLLYTDKTVIVVPNRYGDVNQEIDVQDATFALLRINRGPVAQLLTNPVYRG